MFALTAWMLMLIYRSVALGTVFVLNKPQNAHAGLVWSDKPNSGIKGSAHPHRYYKLLWLAREISNKERILIYVLNDDTILMSDLKLHFVLQE